MARDFAPVSVVVNNVVLVVNPADPAKDAAEFVANSKKKKDPTSMASSGIGSIPHLAIEHLAEASGANLLHVPYKGAAPAITDVMGGQVAGFFGDVPGLIGHVRGGKLKAIGLASTHRHPALPNIKTLAGHSERRHQQLVRAVRAGEDTRHDRAQRYGAARARHAGTASQAARHRCRAGPIDAGRARGDSGDTRPRKQRSIPADLREIVILRVAVLTRAAFEFDAHAPIAEREGVPAIKIDALRRPEVDSAFDARERLVLRLTDAMTRDIDVPDELMRALRRQYDDRQLVELVATVAAYNMCRASSLRSRLGTDALGDVVPALCLGRCVGGVATDVRAGHEDDFNAWYRDEHLPGLAAVPGTVHAARHEVCEGSGPRYHACYDFADRTAFNSPPRLAVRGTPWSSRVRPHFIHTRRTMYRRISSTVL